MSGHWFMQVQPLGWNRAKALYISRIDGPRGARQGARVTFELRPEGSFDDPSLQQTWEEGADALGDVDGFLQAALDEAWQLGMRPKGFADHTNELTAVRYHLEDMRALAKVPVRGEAK